MQRRAGRGRPRAIPSVTSTIEHALPLDRNLARLGRLNQDLASRLRRTAPRPDVRFEPSSQGALTATLGGRQLCSRHRPLEEARRLTDPIDLLEHAVVVVLGFGLGHHVEALVRRVGPAGVVVVFEPDLGLLRAVLERIDHSSWLDTAPLVFITDPLDRGTLAAKLHGAEAIIAQGVRFLEHPAGRWRLAEEAPRFTAAFAEFVSTVKTTLLTTLLRSVETVRNLLLNLDHYAAGPGIAELRDAAAGCPAVIVSAGPSLARNMHLLADPQVGRNCLIVAVQTTLKPLLQAGIKPHFVTALDYHEISARFYEELAPYDTSGTTLVADPKAHPVILDAFPGPVRCCQSPFCDQLLGDLRRDMGDLPAGATVAHLALYLARFMGCDPIIMIGQDLAFTDGLYYAPHTAIESVWAPELNPFNTVEMMQWQRIARHRLHLQRRTDIHGRPVYTDAQMLAYLQQFERDFAGLARDGLHVIDATEGGLPKESTTRSSLREALGRHATRPLPPLPPAGQGLDGARRRAAAERVASVRRDVEAVRLAAAETERLLADLLRGECDEARARRLLAAVDRQRTRVEEHLEALELLNHINQLGAFKRFRADRRIHVQEGLDSSATLRAQLRRDHENVATLAPAAEEMVRQLAAAERLLRGERVEWRPRPARAPGPAIEVGAPPARIAALVPVDPRCSGLLAERDLSAPFAGSTLLQATLERLGRCRGLESIVLIAPRAAPVERWIDAARIGLPVEVERVEGSPFPREQAAIAAARAWAAHCWRGGIGGASVYDEVLCPAVMHPLMQRRGLSAALLAAPDWPLLQEELCSAVVERHLEHPPQLELVFTQAPPGLAGCVVSQRLMGELAARNRRATIGGLLVYQPHAPQGDPIARDANVQIDHRVRGGLVRLVADLPRWAAALDAAVRGAASDGLDAAEWIERVGRCARPGPLPEHVVLEVTTARRSCGRFRAERGPQRHMPLDLARRLLEPLGASPGALLTLDGRGDPLEHPQIVDLLEMARACGIRHIHLRTELHCGPKLIELLAAGAADVVSVDLNADRAATYERMMGHDGFKQALLNLQALLEGRRPLTDQSPAAAMALPWVVPRLQRCDDTLEDVDSFFDRWTHQLAACVIEAGPAGGAVVPAHTPRRARRHQLERRLSVLCDGAVPVSERDRDGRGSAGRIGDAPLPDLWAALTRARDAAAAEPELWSP
jgi:hypothetical protein